MICPRCGNSISKDAQFCSLCKCPTNDFSPERQHAIRDKIMREMVGKETVSSVLFFVLAGLHCVAGVLGLLIHSRLHGAYTFADLISDMKSTYPVPIPIFFPTVYFCFFYMSVLLIGGLYCAGKRRDLITKPDIPLLSVYSARDFIIFFVLMLISGLGVNFFSMFCVFFSHVPYGIIHGRNARGYGWGAKMRCLVVQADGAEIYFER